MADVVDLQGRRQSQGEPEETALDLLERYCAQARAGEVAEPTEALLVAVADTGDISAVTAGDPLTLIGLAELGKAAAQPGE